MKKSVFLPRIAKGIMSWYPFSTWYDVDNGYCRYDKPCYVNNDMVLWDDGDFARAIPFRSKLLPCMIYYRGFRKINDEYGNCIPLGEGLTGKQ